MLLSGVLFVLFLAGCWLYCLTDAALTPAREFRGMSKSAWIGIIAVTFIVGATVWLATRRSRVSQAWTGQQRDLTVTDQDDIDFAWYPRWTASDDAIARHPAGRSRKAATDPWMMPKGPDDDAEFLRELDHRIHGTSADAGE